MSPHHLTHLEPIVTFPTKKGRRVFLFVGSVVFVLILLFLSCGGILLVATTDESEFMMWVLLAGALFGMVFFGAIALGVAKNHLGPPGDIALVLSPIGITDRTQIVGELPLIPWSWITQYNVVTLHGQPLLMLQLRDAEEFRRLLGRSGLMRWSFAINSKMFRAPVHSIAMQHLQHHEQDVLQAIQHFTGFPPGPRT